MKSRSTIFVNILAVLVCLGLLPRVQAVSPPPDGCYPNYTTAAGCNALQSLTTGLGNTAIGWSALFATTTKDYNTAVGAGALDLNSASNNTATGAAALLLNTTGKENTATGVDALAFNDTGSDNTAIGAFALFNSTTDDNTAIGDKALFSNTTGDDNTAVGSFALYTNNTGQGNTADGYSALGLNNTGSNNTAVGNSALDNNSSGASNTAIGYGAGGNQTTGSNNVYIGAGINGIEGESNACRIASIFGQTATSGSAVFITSANKLGTDTSSRRFKEDIKPMEKASEALLALKPVIFRYKKDIDPEAKSQFGLVAEDVEKVNPDLIVRDKQGKPYSVRYDQVNAMLLNEFLKEHKTVQELKSVVVKQEAIAAQQQKQIEALTTRLQKMSAQLEVRKTAPQTVLNNH